MREPRQDQRDEGTGVRRGGCSVLGEDGCVVGYACAVVVSWSWGKSGGEDVLEQRRGRG